VPGELPESLHAPNPRNRRLLRPRSGGRRWRSRMRGISRKTSNPHASTPRGHAQRFREPRNPPGSATPSWPRRRSSSSRASTALTVFPLLGGRSSPVPRPPSAGDAPPAPPAAAARQQPRRRPTPSAASTASCDQKSIPNDTSSPHGSTSPAPVFDPLQLLPTPATPRRSCHGMPRKLRRLAERVGGAGDGAKSVRMSSAVVVMRIPPVLTPWINQLYVRQCLRCKA